MNHRGQLVVTELVLQVLLPFGAYAMCNVCTNGTDQHGINCTAFDKPDGQYVW